MLNYTWLRIISIDHWCVKSKLRCVFSKRTSPRESWLGSWLISFILGKCYLFNTWIFDKFFVWSSVYCFFTYFSKHKRIRLLSDFNINRMTLRFHFEISLIIFWSWIFIERVSYASSYNFFFPFRALFLVIYWFSQETVFNCGCTLRPQRFPPLNFLCVLNNFYVFFILA